MHLKMTAKVTVTGALAKNQRLVNAIASLPLIRLWYDGVHSELHVANSSIAKHALAHGDNVFCIQPETLAEMAKLARRGLVLVARNPSKQNAVAEMLMAQNAAVAGLTTAVLEGKTGGPARSPEWNAYKASHWGAPTPNMIASREWLRSLRGKLVERQRNVGSFLKDALTQIGAMEVG